ncbi:MAG TPA: extracellular solute-binding protein [Rhizomicrobium sp.]|nr:extracellular solute-binding protein [Rhizomicrobium sp.]
MKTGWLLGGVAAVLMLGVGGYLALRGGGAPASGPVTLFQWQDYMDAPFLKDYEAATGEKPAITIFADEDEAFAKMRAGFRPDVMGPCYYEFPRWKEAGLLKPIEVSRLKNWKKLSPTLRNLPGISAGPGKVWFVPHYWGNTSLTIRTDLAPEYAKSQSWEILFDPKYKGRVSVLDGVDDVVPFIAKMIGVDAYTMSEADWRKVQARLKELVPQLRFVSSDDTALAQGLASGELVAAMSWRTTFAALRRENRPVAYLEPPGGMFTYVCGLTLHADTRNEDKALALIDSSLSDAASVYTVEHIGDEPANTEAMKQVPDSVFEALQIPRDLETFLKHGTFQRRLKDKDKLISAWTEIKSGIQ